jgi:hypothetical protein
LTDPAILSISCCIFLCCCCVCVVRFKNLSEETRSFPKPEVHSITNKSIPQYYIARAKQGK